MKLAGVCIETDDAPRLAEFYKIVLHTSALRTSIIYRRQFVSVGNGG